MKCTKCGTPKEEDREACRVCFRPYSLEPPIVKKLVEPTPVKKKKPVKRKGLLSKLRGR